MKVSTRPQCCHQSGLKTLGEPSPLSRVWLDFDSVSGSFTCNSQARKDQINFTAEMLAGLPPELLQELRDSTLTLNMEVNLEVIDRIEAHAPETAEHLRALVQTFQIQRIREVLKKVEDK